MEIKCFRVEADEGDRRLDLFLASKKKSLSRSFLQKLCREGHVYVDGAKQSKTGYRVKEGQNVKLCIPPPKVFKLKPEDIPLEIIYEDSDLLVVNKPKGMVVHPAAGHCEGTLVNALLSHCENLAEVGDKTRPGIVHRLDKDTSGLLVVAKSDLAYKSLNLQLKKRKMKREYLAVVHHLPPRKKGIIDAPLGRGARERKKFVVKEIGEGRKAVTYYKVIGEMGPFYLLSVKLETGRTHQIRVHLAFIGCPVVGDPLYGPKRSPYKKYGQFLHARTLGFQHPRSLEYLEFCKEPGKAFSCIFSPEER